ARSQQTPSTHGLPPQSSADVHARVLPMTMGLAFASGAVPPVSATLVSGVTLVSAPASAPASALTSGPASAGDSKVAVMASGVLPATSGSVSADIGLP